LEAIVKLGQRVLLATSVLAALVAARTASANLNIVLNPSFKSDVSFWSVGSGAFTWNWTNAVGNGAYAVTTSAQGTLGVLTQCMNALPSTTYYFGGGYEISASLSGRPLGELHVSWFNQANCTGTSLRVDATDPSNTDTGYWQQLATSVASPVGTKSARLVCVVKNPAAVGATVYFDGLYFESLGFLAGDANADGSVDIADVFYLVNFLFAGGAVPAGPTDVNDDHLLNVSDVFYLINYLFAGGPTP
jgi:hypothetical protein